MLEDIRLAIRSLVKSPAFALTTVAVLALGIGANSAIFSLVNQVLLQPDGIDGPGRVVALRAKYDKLKMPSISASGPDFRDVAQGGAFFECAAISSGGDYNYSGGDRPERLQGAEVSWRWFDVFGAVPEVGRPFRPEEDQPEANTVAILAHATWIRLFGGDPNIANRSISLNGKSYKVVGVMKSDFRLPRQADLWVPLGLPPKELTDDYRFNEHLQAFARMRPGVSFEQASAFVALAAERVRSAAGENAAFARDAQWGMFLLPITTYLATDTRWPLLVLMGSVALVLLIACANVAGLMVARAAGRSRDLAVRAALGASTWRLLRQAMAESLVLAVAGATLGLGIAVVGSRLLLLMAPEEATMGLAARIDAPVLLFTLAAALVAAALSAAAPALQAAHLAPYEHIKSGTRTATAGRGRQRLRAGLVISETALALVLLVGAGLLLRSLSYLQDVNPGFEASNVTTAQLSLPAARYGTPEQKIAFYRATTERLAASAGVVAAAAALPLPFSGNDQSASFMVEGRIAGPGDPGPHGGVRYVTPGYFAALGIRVTSGRIFTDADRIGGLPVAVIDENLARQYWPNQDPVGKRLRRGSREEWTTVIGVVGHVRHSDFSADTGKGVYYYSLFQQPLPFAALVVKTAPGESRGAAIIRQAVAEVDPGQPIHHVRSLADAVLASLAPQRFVMHLLAFFATVALVMAAIGLYGVISYSVAQRTSEIGVRLALGASRGHVLRMVVTQGLGLAGVGVAAGLAAAIALSRLLTSQLFGVHAFDPSTYGVVTVTLLGAALLASYLPARRATQIDPLAALRE